MSEQTPQIKPTEPETSIEKLLELNKIDLRDLCDATDAAIQGGGGFGWVELPARDIMERYWQGVVTIPTRLLYVARLDGVICGTLQLIEPASHNQAQAHMVQLTTNFVAPWARGYSLARKLLSFAEEDCQSKGFSVINLDVRETMVEAISLYESAGYKRFGEHPHYAVLHGDVIKGFYYTKTL